MTKKIIFGLLFCLLLVSFVSAEVKCSETPDDNDIYTASYIRAGERIYENVCERDSLDGKKLLEPSKNLFRWQCVNDQPKRDILECEYDCFDGACVTVQKYNALKTECNDFDNGIKPFKRGYATSEYGQEFDVCVDQNSAEVSSCSGASCFLIEYYCERNNRGILKENIDCEYGCSAGACIKCNGCLKDEECMKIGTVYNDEFCSEFYNWEKIRPPGETCTDSYQCDTEFCKDGSCFIECNGCWFESQCITYNTVLEDQYCEKNKKEMVPRKYIGATCDADFECKTGYCYNGVCRTFCKNGCFTPEFECKLTGLKFRDQYCGYDNEMHPLKQYDEFCGEDYECFEGYCDGVCKKYSLWNRMISWIKDLF